MRQVRARFDENEVTVYQAFSPAIADAALVTGKFVVPFRRGRMTWIKPSFLWMAYRSGWATKRGQERILAISLSRDGFEWALGHGCLSSFDPGVNQSREEWQRQKATCPVRIQWDPERDLTLAPLKHRSIQIGLSGEAVDRYVDDWLIAMTDMTEFAHGMAELVENADLATAQRLLPIEEPYPLPDHLVGKVGAAP